MKGCSSLGFLLYFAMAAFGILMVWRVWKRHGRLIGLFYGVIILLFCLVWGPGKIETFVFRALLRLL